MSSTQHAPLSKWELEHFSTYLGTTLHDPNIPTPAAVIDLAAARRNCQRMLNACRDLDFSFRADVRSHKSSSLVRLQCGTEGPLRVTVSTLREAEELGDMLRDAAAEGREVDVMYGSPVRRGDVKRLAALASARHSEGGKAGKVTRITVSVLVDDPEQLENLRDFKKLLGGPVPNVHKAQHGHTLWLLVARE